jgi:hypothetical protein
MTIQPPAIDIIFFSIIWLILLEHTLIGYLMLWKKRETFGCLLEGGFSIVRMVFGREQEEKNRNKLLQSRLFRIEYTIAWIAGLLFLIFLTGWLLNSIISL